MLGGIFTGVVLFKVVDDTDFAYRTNCEFYGYFMLFTLIANVLSVTLYIFYLVAVGVACRLWVTSAMGPPGGCCQLPGLQLLQVMGSYVCVVEVVSVGIPELSVFVSLDTIWRGFC